MDASVPCRTRARRPDVAIRNVEILDLADPLASPLVGDFLIDGDRIVELEPGVAASQSTRPGHQRISDLHARPHEGPRRP
jgi:hypothetical protein